MKWIIVLSLLLSLFSCSDIKKSRQLASIDTMEKSIDSIQKVLEANEIDTIAAVTVATMTVELRIKNNYYADTIDMALGKKMDAFKLMRRKIPKLGTSFNTIKTGVKDQKSALSNLKSDIENGNGDRKKYAEYVAFEEGKTQQLRVLLKDYVVEKEKTMKEFNNLYPEMNAFSLSLLNSKKNVSINK